MATESNGDEVLDFTKTVTVLVGSEERLFTIPECLVTKTSEFLRTALNKRWNEGKERVVKLPEADPACFNAYTQWLYTKTVARKLRSSDKMDDDDTSSYNLMELYLLGHFLRDTAFMNKVINAFIDVMREKRQAPGPQTIASLWERMPTECKMKNLIMMQLSFEIFPGGVDPKMWEDDLPKSFWFDLVQWGRLVVFHEYEKSNFSRCFFHEHNDKVVKETECSRPALF